MLYGCMWIHTHSVVEVPIVTVAIPVLIIISFCYAITVECFVTTIGLVMTTVGVLVSASGRRLYTLQQCAALFVHKVCAYNRITISYSTTVNALD